MSEASSAMSVCEEPEELILEVRHVSEKRPAYSNRLKSIVDRRRPIDDECGELLPQDDESEQNEEGGDIAKLTSSTVSDILQTLSFCYKKVGCEKDQIHLSDDGFDGFVLSCGERHSRLLP